ncbi:MAG TPA: efflux RND transporter permease subunit, partial [Pseudomonadales bacterium]|nr:efflux RND transporter permease subunit [Pseudomonadales bacterium]
TLLALAVVVGILVDDAVVEVENIARHLNMGKSPMQATLDAVNEIALAVIATTFTLVAVFAPMAFMTGVPGKVFKQFGWSLVAAVLFSLLVARMLTPMMATWLLKAGHVEPPESRLMRLYIRSVDWCLRHRKTTLLGGIGFFIASLGLTPFIPTSFLPPDDQGAITINMELPPGASLSASLATAEEIRKAVAGVKGVQSVFTTVGNAQFVEGAAGDMAGEVNRGNVVLILTPREQRQGQKAIESEIRPRLEQVAGARLSIGAGDRGERLQIVLASQDLAALKASAQAIERELRDRVPQLSSITSSASLDRAEVTVRPDAALAAERGVNTQMIGETLRIALAGDFESALSKLNLDNRQIDIRVQVPAAYRRDLDAIGNLRIPGKEGLVTLSSIATLSLESGPSQIKRFDRSRQVTINADLGGFAIGEAIKARDALPAVKALPPNVQLIDGEDAEVMKEMMGQFNMALVMGVMLIYTVLVLLFKNWFQPITILSALPLSIGGAFVALLITRYPLGMSALIGILMLLGIVTKNSILLVDFAVKAQREMNMPLHDALIDACRKRARPIMMTTVAMMAGLAPLAFGFSGDSEFRQPMAIAVTGGLVTSTALSLLLVPVVFVYISRLQNWLESWRKSTDTVTAPTTHKTEPSSQT